MHRGADTAQICEACAAKGPHMYVLRESFVHVKKDLLRRIVDTTCTSNTRLPSA